MVNIAKKPFFRKNGFPYYGNYHIAFLLNFHYIFRTFFTSLIFIKIPLSSYFCAFVFLFSALFLYLSKLLKYSRFLVVFLSTSLFSIKIACISYHFFLYTYRLCLHNFLYSYLFLLGARHFLFLCLPIFLSGHFFLFPDILFSFFLLNFSFLFSSFNFGSEIFLSTFNLGC